MNTYSLKRKVSTKYTSKDNRALVREELVTVATGLSWADAKAQSRKDKTLIIFTERITSQPQQETSA